MGNLHSDEEVIVDYVSYKAPDGSECGCTTLERWEAEPEARRSVDGQEMAIVAQFSASNWDEAMQKHYDVFGWGKYTPMDSSKTTESLTQTTEAFGEKSPRSHLRPEVLAFATLMEAKLRKNDHKKHWSTCDIDYLEERLEDEVDELKLAVRERTSEVVAREAADVANYAMMIADKLGGLPSARVLDEDVRQDVVMQVARLLFQAFDDANEGREPPHDFDIVLECERRANWMSLARTAAALGARPRKVQSPAGVRAAGTESPADDKRETPREALLKAIQSYAASWASGTSTMTSPAKTAVFMAIDRLEEAARRGPQR